MHSTNLFTSFPDPLIVVDQAGKLIANPAAKAHFGTDSIHRIIDKIDSRRSVKDVIEFNGAPYRYRTWFDDQGACIVHFLRSKFETLTVSPESFLTRQLYKVVDDIIFILDEEQQFTYMNPFAYRYFAIRPWEIRSKKLSDFIHPADRKQLQIQSQERSRIKMNVRLTCRVTDFRWHSLRLSPIDLNNRQYLIGYARDISEQKQAETELAEHRADLEKLVQQRTKQLLEAERMAVIGRHASHLAHNLNGSLTTILGRAQLLELTLNGNAAKVEPNLRQINDAALKMRSTISDMMLRIRNDHQPVRVEFNLNQMIRQQLVFFEENSDGRQPIEFITVLDENLPNFDAVVSDFTQIFDNLMTNSIDALSNRPQKSITIRTEFRDGEIVWHHSDTGSGIEPEHVERIFDPHFTTKPVGKGTGLGLASVSELLTHYDSVISVDSEPGKGTHFMINIPTSHNRNTGNAGDLSKMKFK